MVVKTENYTAVTYGRSSMIVYDKRGNQIYYTASMRNVPLWSKEDIISYTNEVVKYCEVKSNG